MNLRWGWVTVLLLALGCGESAKSPARPTAGSGGDPAAGGEPSDGGKTSAGQASGGSSNGSKTGGASNGGQAGQSSGGQGGSGGENPYPPSFSEGRCRPSGPELADVAGVKSMFKPGGSITGLMIDGQTLYYNDYSEEQVWRRTGEGEPELVATDVRAWNMFVRGDYLYFISGNNRDLQRVSLQSPPGTPEMLRTGIGDRSQGFLATETDVFFQPHPNRGVHTLPLTALVPNSAVAPKVLDPAAMAQPQAMRVVGVFLYYSDYSAAYRRVPSSGGTPPELFAGIAGVGDFAVGENELYLIGGPSLVKQPFEGGGPAQVQLATSSDKSDLARVELVGDRLIYREKSGAIAWVKTDGSDCRIIAKVPAFSNLEDRSWVMDDHYIYLTQEEEELWAIPYP